MDIVDKMFMYSRIIFSITTIRIRPWLHFTVSSESVSMRKFPSWFVMRIHWRHHWRANASARVKGSCLYSSFVAENPTISMASNCHSSSHCIILKLPAPTFNFITPEEGTKIQYRFSMN